MYRIMLVDDEKIFLEYMSTACDWASHGCEIIGCAEDGVSAWELVNREMPDVVFVDVNIPRMDGLELCRRIREAGLPVRLVIVTAHDEFQFAYQAIKLGIDDFLLKPFGREELEQALKKALCPGAQSGDLVPDGAAQDEAQEESSTKFEIMAGAIDAYLEAHYPDSELSLQTLSRELTFESSYLRRAYKYSRGMTITQRLEELRIEQAKRLLRTGRYQIREISAMTGFSDPYYFSRRFKQVVGVSPKDYRK